MRDYYFLTSNFNATYPEAEPLLKKQWEELAVNKEVRPLDPNTEGYKTLEQLGVLRVYAARKIGDTPWNDRLIGYATFIISNSLHYKTWRVAADDVYYIDPDYRKNGVGKEFFEYIIEDLKRTGVNSVYFHDKISHSHGRLFNALNATAIEQTYELVI